jgi:FixJ family two-component response regulator
MEQARGTVAVVDDDSRIRESVESLLDSAGYHTVVFRSAEEFLESATTADAICLITDVRMPGMNGLELHRRIKSDRPKLCVIFISAHYDEEVRQRALEQGATSFLYKPFDAGDLLQAIQSALSASRDYER